MPRGNRTGPAGWGPMTGRGMGYCAGYEAPGYAYQALGYGRRRGGRGGAGRGWRHGYHATGLPRWARYDDAPDWYGPYGPPMSEEQETDLLTNQADALKRELEAISKRLDELESEG